MLNSIAVASAAITIVGLLRILRIRLDLAILLIPKGRLHKGTIGRMPQLRKSCVFRTLSKIPTEVVVLKRNPNRKLA
jgi:hypothetical protein